MRLGTSDGGDGTHARPTRRLGGRVTVVALGVVVAATLTACSSTTPNGASSAPKVVATKSDAITIRNFAFRPATLTVAPGATVTVTNKDSVTHTLTSDSGAFNSGNIPAGSTVHFTAPSKSGSYPYRCNIHQFMTAVLHVS
jgi:plastocyanin